MNPTVRIEPSADGSLTAYHGLYNEYFHSKHGALSQARQVYLEGTETHRHPEPHVLEVGFGLGLNFLVTLQNARQRGAVLSYIAYEKDPVPLALLEAFQHGLSGVEDVWEAVLAAWESPEGFILQGVDFRLEVCFRDVRQVRFPEGWASAIYLDPFSPRTNPEPWAAEVLQGLFRAARPGAVLTTYSVAGQVRRDLAAAGFTVTKVPGALGKREWLRATKPGACTAREAPRE